MEKDIKAIALLLTTQSMINLGEIEDPITKETRFDLEGAEVFIQLLGVLKEKTEGNLTPEEKNYLVEMLDNLEKVHEKKLKLKSKSNVGY